MTRALPKFFRVRQRFERPCLEDLNGEVFRELSQIGVSDIEGKSVAITAGSRGVANISVIIKACVDFLAARKAKPFVVPAMGSHGGATAEGQLKVLESYGITSETMGCPVKSSMDVEHVCDANEGFPVFIDRHAANADGVLVVNRIKPHTRFAGELESGLMKMMLIGLGKKQGAEVYHQVIAKYSFDQIVRSVAGKVIEHCNVLGGLAILENAYEETALVKGVRPDEIESTEPNLLKQVKEWMPQLPFDHAELLMIDQIGKNISGTGMDTNVVGRKKNDHVALDGEKPDIHHIYVRDLTDATHGNASGIGLAELCHRRVLEKMDRNATRTNCIIAGHVTGAMIPVDFATDREAMQTACQLAGYVEPDRVSAMWIKDTLHIDEVECSEVFWADAQSRPELEIVSEPQELNFDSKGDLVSRFGSK